MSVRVAESLLKLRSQIDAMAPGRATSSDGPIGDPSYQARKSDYAPNSDGVVTAIDITHDPAHGVDAGEIAEELRLSKDARIKYVISDGRVFSSQVEPWQWRPYMGADAHPGQVHVAVAGDKARYDDTNPWAIEGSAKVIEPPQVTESSQVVEPPRYAEPPQPPLEQASKRYTDIVATVFGGAGEDESSAYDGHRIGETELGVALPFRFEAARPDVKVTNRATEQSVVCKIVDIGPWNTDDPYWESGSRPQAESGRDKRGRMTNRAGIDLTPAAARAIGLDGKGPVDWEFVVAPPEVEPRIQVEEADRGARVQADELVQRLESVMEKTSRDDTSFRPYGYEAFPTTPSDTSAEPKPARGRAAANTLLMVDEMAYLSAACRATPRGRSGVIVSDGRVRDDRAGAGWSGSVTLPRSPAPGSAPPSPDDVAALLERLVTVVERVTAQGPTTIPSSAPSQTEELQKALELLKAIMAPGTDDKSRPLSQVNGALGETLGNLLNGKKTAIGVLGALVTSILSQVPAASGLGQVLALLTPSAGLSPFAMPIFLAMAAWGVLGKFEKWSQESAVKDDRLPSSARSDTLQSDLNLLLQVASIARTAASAPTGAGAGGRGSVDQQTFTPSGDLPRGDVAADRQFPEPIQDWVRCSVFGPPAAPPGQKILIQVFLHLSEQADAAWQEARIMDPSAALKGRQSLEAAIKRGARVDISLAADTLEVDEPVQSVIWWGEPTYRQFELTIPPGSNGRNFHPKVRLSVDGQPVGRISFSISADGSAVSPQSTSLGDHAGPYQYVFLSYADEDRREVAASARLMDILKHAFFLDKVSLRSGDRWEEKLYDNIDRCDLFLLFWSSYAQNSYWVMREVDYAFGRQSRDPNGDPDIVPVKLQEDVELPPRFADRHFDHPLNSMIFAGRPPQR
jgi:TIR domain